MAENSSDFIKELIESIYDPVRQAEHALWEANRTDPWIWYCRICGAIGSHEHPGKEPRDAEAIAHIKAEHWGPGMILGTDFYAHSMHVWSYPHWAE